MRQHGNATLRLPPHLRTDATAPTREPDTLADQVDALGGLLREFREERAKLAQAVAELRAMREGEE